MGCGASAAKHSYKEIHAEKAPSLIVAVDAGPEAAPAPVTSRFEGRDTEADAPRAPATLHKQSGSPDDRTDQLEDEEDPPSFVCQPCDAEQGRARQSAAVESLEEREARAKLGHCLRLRRKYIFPAEVAPQSISAISHPGAAMIMVDGVAEVAGIDLPEIPSRAEFKKDLVELWKLAKTPQIKTVAMSRLDRLTACFRFYKLDYAAVEREEQAELEQDLYSVMKVDNHIHLAAAMTPRQLLRFIKDKLMSEPDREVVAGKTLQKVMADALLKPNGERQASQLTPAECAKLMHVDALRTCAGEHCYHRFDNFNDAYSPLGCAQLRGIFLKSSNFLDGHYFGELTRKVIDGLDATETFTEMRLSIYGRSVREWDDLARWLRANKLHEPEMTRRNLWMVQVPRLFGAFYKTGVVKNFEELVNNIFQPLFEVVLDPSSHPDLAEVLPTIIGFDCVDDESVPDPLVERQSQVYGNKNPTEMPSNGDVLCPQLWAVPENPPYSYYCFYLYANLRRFNDLCRAMGRPWKLSFRPHSGEAGEVHHLATSFLLADGINHGVNLYHTPVLQYLYYVAQIGVSVAPMSNNALFLRIVDNPFPRFFQRGLNVALSTDDPLMFHTTNEPLLEEYTVSRHAFGLTNTDLCEIAGNSVRQSGFSPEVKRAALGAAPGPYVWEPRLCNVPACRLLYRRQRLSEEVSFLRSGSKPPEELKEPDLDLEWS